MSEPADHVDALASAERHATNLELFLDLVFVFAVTQIASLISRHPSGTGTAKGLLMAILVWWQWSQFAWTGSAVDLQRETRTRILVLCLIPVTLIMAISIPNAFHGDAIWFGAAYLGVQTVVIAALGMYAMVDEATRRGYWRYASVASFAPALVFGGAFAHDNARVMVWTLAALVNFVGALRAGGGDWIISPVHFAERHALFVIIALGEVLVTAGASATETGLRRHIAIAIVVSVMVACTVWWAYFAFIPEVGEQALRQRTGAARGRLARDLYTFGHFPLVFGIILYAVVVKHLVPSPEGHLSIDDRWLLALSFGAFVGGLAATQLRVVRKVAPERLLAIPVVALWCVAGARMPGVVTVGGVAVAYAAMQAVTLRRLWGKEP
ncbi:MAG: low temperature requirement protein A [Actinomycetota bacterium]